MPDQVDEERAIAAAHPCVALRSGAGWNLHPVTIFQVLQAEASPFFDDKSLVIEGRGFAAVTFVAHVTSVEVQSAKTTYTLEDGTGRIRAEKELNSLRYHHGLSPEAEKEEAAQSKALEHTYVEVTGVPQKGNPNWAPKFKMRSIVPVHSYNQVLYHILNVIESNRLIQEHLKPYSSSGPAMDFHWQPSGDSDMEIDMPVDGGQARQDDVNASHPILPSSFLPHRQQPYAALQPLERAIMKHMHHNKHCQVLVTDMGQVIQASYGCTEVQFDLAIQTLLLEAYVTSPLDDGYVILTPRR